MYCIVGVADELKSAFELKNIHYFDVFGRPFKSVNGIVKFMTYILSLLPRDSYSYYYNSYLSDCEFQSLVTPTFSGFVQSIFSPFFWRSFTPVYDNYCTSRRFNDMLFPNPKIPGLCTEKKDVPLSEVQGDFQEVVSGASLNSFCASDFSEASVPS